ncbi:hypothetical protein PNOK_0933400 [Pyrrhoderma noxium]|uniref:Uncharacterized protein n=1 Tax=Pyrrhoderma noxium TaxID=2282107 RepID=A0A286U5C8_9AGAM|nr:hypothetical protein PNOK_0933400 [Pyrrhoderma noxium]
MFNLSDIFNLMAFLSALPFFIFIAKNIIDEPNHISIPAPAELSMGVASDHRSGEATNDELPPPYSPGDYGRRFLHTRQPPMNQHISALLPFGERSTRHPLRERVPRSGASRGQPPNTENQSRESIPCTSPGLDFVNSRLILTVICICVDCE